MQSLDIKTQRVRSKKLTYLIAIKIYVRVYVGHAEGHYGLLDSADGLQSLVFDQSVVGLHPSVFGIGFLILDVLSALFALRSSASVLALDL